MSQALVFQHKAWTAEIAFNLSVWMLLSKVRHLAHVIPKACSTRTILRALETRFPYAISCSVRPDEIRKQLIFFVTYQFKRLF